MMSLRKIDEVVTACASVTSAMEVLHRCSILQRSKICHGCGGRMRLVQSAQGKYRTDDGWCYYCSPCRRYRSLRAGTVLDQTSKPLSFFVILIWAFAVGDFGVCLHIIHTFCTHTLSAYYPHIIRILSTYYPHTLPTYYLH